MTTIDFQTWLSKEVNLSPKSARDVVSRYNRALRLTVVKQSQDVEDMIDMLTQQQDFKNLSPSIRSQIKRALRLHSSFVGSRKQK
ncbi:hypothetical protein ACFLUZ_01895 [Chloroflexota bacterium]